MRIRVLVLALVLIPSFAKSQELGCFVEPSNPAICSNKILACSTDTALNYGLFGFSAGNLCERLVSVAINAQACENDLVLCSSDKHILAVGGGKLQATIRKLRRACGSKCRNIK